MEVMLFIAWTLIGTFNVYYVIRTELRISKLEQEFSAFKFETSADDQDTTLKGHTKDTSTKLLLG